MFGALGGIFTVVAGLFGAIAYVGLSFAAEEVYSTVGVNPSEVGLGYASLLSESALVVALVVAPGILAVLVVSGARAMMVPRNGTQGPSTSDRTTHPLFGGRSRRTWVISTLVIGILYSAMVAFWVVVPDVREQRKDLLGGKASHALAPWDHEVVAVRWLDDSGSLPTLPSCMLYLGRSDGTAVFYAADSKRTMRLPASAVMIDAKRDAPDC